MNIKQFSLKITLKIQFCKLEKFKYYKISLCVSGTLTIVIEDENDNNPMFRKPFYRKFITENSQLGVPIVNVVADDSDKNRTIMYTLEGISNTFIYNSSK